MKDLPRAARIYIWLLSGLGLAAVLVSLPLLVVDPTFGLVVCALAIVIALLDHYPVRLYSSQADTGVEITISVAVKIAAILLVPPQIVILTVFGGTLLAELWQRRVWYKLIFNISMMTVSWTVVAVIFNLLYQPNAPLFGSIQNLFALAALGVSDVAINGILVSLVIALTTETPVRYVWTQLYKPLVLQDLSMLPIGVLLYLLWQYAPWSIVLAALPLFVMRHSYQLVADLRRQTRQALYALAHVLDERDQRTSRHSELVAENAGLIARALGLDAEQVDVIVLAAVMHDIGKIGMRNDVLFKTSSLSQEEREMAKRHAAIGAELLQKFPLFGKGASYVRHHHERWDGAGYPDGLSGEAIPLGARILAVADAYQAMIEERPYRGPLPEKVAFQQLWEGAGSQFDSKIVIAFLRAKGVTPPITVETPSIAAQEVIPIADGR